MPFPGQMSVWAGGEFRGWLQSGTGLPLSYPNDWLILGIYSAIATILAPALLSKFTLVAVPLIAAFGTYFLARRDLRLPILAACVAAAFAAINPVLFNKMIAGQLGYLWGYALLPWWLFAYRVQCARATDTLAVRIAAGAVAAVMSSQIQFVVFIVVIMLADGIASKRRRTWDALAAPALSLGITVIAQVGTLASLSRGVGALAQAVVNAPALDWVSANSATPVEAFGLRGYVTHYFENAYAALPFIGGWFTVAGLLFAVITVIGFIVAWRDARLRAFALIWIIGVFATMGVNAPGGFLIAWLYDHVRAMQLFREVYHWAVLAELGAAMLIGCAVAALLRRRTSIAAAGVALIFGCLALYSVPILTGDWSGQIQTVQTSSQLQAFVQRTDAEPPTARILWLPIDQPMSPPNGRFAGLDPMLYMHPPSLAEYVLTPPISAIALGLREQKSDGLDRLLDYVGVGTIVVRKGFASQVPAFALRQAPNFSHDYATGANERGVQSLHWRLGTDDDAVTAYRAPSASSIVAVASDFVLVSPSVSLLRFVPVQSSPVGAQIPPAIGSAIYEQPDIDTLIAQCARQKRDLLAEGITLPSVDATQSWSPIEGWWYYRYAFTQALDASLISLGASSHQGAILHLNKVPAGARLIVGYVDSPFGGTLALDLPGGRTVRIDTRAAHSHLASTVIPIAVAGPIALRNLGGEQALRHVFVVLPGDWSSAVVRFTSLLVRARRATIALGGSPRFYAPFGSVYTIRDVQEIDGKSVDGRMYLARGWHTVRADDDAILRAGKPPSPLRGAVSDIRASDFGELYSGVVAPHVRILRLRTTYSTGWELRLSDGSRAQHLAGDLFMNAWLLADSQSPRDFSIVYEPSWAISGLHRVSAYTLIALIVLSLGLGVFGRRTKKVRRDT